MNGLCQCAYIRGASASLRLIEGRIEGPDVCDEIFANVHLRELARKLTLDLLVPRRNLLSFDKQPR